MLAPMNATQATEIAATARNRMLDPKRPISVRVA